MNPVTDPAKKSHEAKGVDKKKESHAPAVKDDKAPEPKPASNADDRLTPEEVERDYQFFDVSKVPDSFFALAVAPRRNGKSEMLQSLLEEFHKDKAKKFDYVFLFSQTGQGYEQQIPPTFRFTDLAHLPAICQEQMRIKRHNEKAKLKKDRVKSRILLILDDMIGDSTGPNSLKSNDMIRKLGVNGRHLGNDKVEGNGINVIILTQSLKAVPKVVRQQIDILFAGKCASRVEREALVYEFLCLRSDRDGIKEAYRVYDGITYSAPYRFITISNYIQERMCHKDYVGYYNATYPVKQHRLFGDNADWMEELNHTSIFDE